MRYQAAIPALVSLMAAPAAAHGQVALPDTPAGQFVSVFLDAYNSADRATLERYNARYGRKSPPQTWIDMHAMTGRLTPMLVEPDGSNRIRVLLSAEHGDAFWEEKVEIDPADPMKVVHAGLGPTDRPPQFAIPRLPRAELRRCR
jgi:D-alanyl-D-alanine carboxypeptidase